MIYVTEKDFNHQLKLISFVAKTIDCNICAWLYPESSSSEIAGCQVTQNLSKLDQVTTYENQVIPKCTSPLEASAEVLSAFVAAQESIKNNCDSLALYKKNESSWIAASIGHEGMCLVQDESLLSSLINAGFNASLKAPSWW